MGGHGGGDVGRVGEADPLSQQTLGDADIGAVEKGEEGDTDDVLPARPFDGVIPFAQQWIGQPLFELSDLVGVQLADVATALTQKIFIEGADPPGF